MKCTLNVHFVMLFCLILIVGDIQHVNDSLSECDFRFRSERLLGQPGARYTLQSVFATGTR